ncbi:hypothetical protein DL93DRAFT_2091220 [Clavulina sp. PMI_390]|nr:hypothetical protein DL93DRAFT_2091220 [Clavulina sp. PMI_390]
MADSLIEATSTAQPYTPGSTLLLYVLPPQNESADACELDLSSLPTISIVVDQPFLPYTKGQAMRISIPSTNLSLPAHISTLPPRAVLKLYDRRWIDDRRSPSRWSNVDERWTPEREAFARRAWREWDASYPHPFLDHSFVADNKSDWEPYGEPEEPDQDEYGEALPQSETKYVLSGEDVDECEDAADTEHRFWEMSMRRFLSEREAYRRLAHLQGDLIPRCYGAVQLVPSVDDQSVPQSFVYGLILEEVTGTCLDDLSDKEEDDHYDAIKSYCGGRLMSAVESFPSYGVLHCDIRSGNLLFSSSPSSVTDNPAHTFLPTSSPPSNTPARPRLTLLDFGGCTLRPSDHSICTDTEWAGRVKHEDELEQARFILSRRHFRDRTPDDIRFKGVMPLGPIFRRPKTNAIGEKVRSDDSDWGKMQEGCKDLYEVESENRRFGVMRRDGWLDDRDLKPSMKRWRDRWYELTDVAAQARKPDDAVPGRKGGVKGVVDRRSKSERKIADQRAKAEDAQQASVWRLRPFVAEWLDAIPTGPERHLIPRPGSPDFRNTFID